MKKYAVLAIDFQHDFCDPTGNLYVGGAEKDSERAGQFLKTHGKRINNVICTLDSHQVVHVAHPVFWKDGKGNHPAPFTTISYQDLKDGKWSTTKASLLKWAEYYLKQLEKNNRYPLMVWPPHCLIGTKGHSLHQPFLEGVLDWAQGFRIVDFVTKGSNALTEHYSAVQADVPLTGQHGFDADPSTGINMAFINAVDVNDVTIVMGEASSHCVLNTLKDMWAVIPDLAKKMVIFKDCMSPVGLPPCIDAANQFLKDAENLGVQVCNSTDYF